MSVTQNGPAGYEYQYLASLYLYLHFRNVKNVTGVYIDRGGKGDLCLTVEDTDGTEQAYEFECKERKPGLDIDYFIKCLSRFDPRSNNKYVLSKLHDGTTEHFYIFTSSRAEQFSSDFSIIVNNASLEKHTKKVAKRLLNEFRNSIINKRTETATRNIFISDHLKGLDVPQVGSILEKITIVDQVDKKVLNERITRLLGDRKIAISVQENLVPKLLQIIKDGRESGGNILEVLNSLISEALPFLPQLLKSYIKIGDEDILLKELKENKLLLLSGASLCGKTQRCYYIVNLLSMEFPIFKYLVTNDIQTAEKFILSNSEDEGRICYLEDPLGQYPGDSDNARCKQLENLINNLPKEKDRYLICTSTTQVTNSLSNRGYLSSFKWHDLTLTDESKAFEIWSAMTASSVKINQTVNKLIKEAISVSDGKDLLQPGQLAFLSKYDFNAIPSSVAEIRHLAQFRAQDITNLILKEKSLILAMEIMAMGATTHFGLSHTELEYMSEKDKEYLPGINKFDPFSAGSGLIGRNIKDYTICTYKEFEYGQNDLINSVSNLIDLGYLSVFANQYVFAHPIYQEAARKLWSGDNPIRFNCALQNLRKLIGCLNSKIVLHAVKNLHLLFKNATTTDQQQQIIKLGELATKSTFVVVREEAALFLISYFEILNSEQKGNLWTLFERRVESGRSTYFWQDDIAFVPDVEDIEREWSKNYLSKTEIEQAWSDYLKQDALLPSENAGELLESMIRISRVTISQLHYDVTALKSFLRYDEAFIREDAAYLLAASISEDTFDQLKEIYFENDAFVKLQLIKGLFRSYPYFNNKSKQKEVFDFMLSIFDDPFVVFGAIPLFTQFSAGYSTATFDWWYEIAEAAYKPMWYLWGELMIILFKHLPTDARINEGRFQGTLEEALITDKSKVAILCAYTGWLQRYYQDPKRSFMMVEVFFPFLNETFSKINKARRLELVKQMLGFNDDYFQLNLINLLVLKWKILNKEEQNMLIEKIPNLSNNAKIIVFCNKESCEELQIAAKGFSIAGKDVETVVGLLRDCLLEEIIYANYVDLSVQQISSKNEELWNAVLKYCLLHPEEKAFVLALKIFIEDIFYFRRTRNGLWDNSEDLFSNIISNCNQILSKYTASVLILYLMDDRYIEIGKYLKILYEAVNEEIREFTRVTICENIESISNASNWNVAKDYISRDFESEYLASDITIFKLMDAGLSDDTDVEINKAFGTFAAFAIKNKKIRLAATMQVINNWFGKNASLLNDEQRQTIGFSWQYLSAKCNEQKKEMELVIKNIFNEYLGRDDMHFNL
ncbi:hypothetical protein [Flavobacterium sp. PS2]|uniref:nSTAND3 domain-containing NTPase n=1 Tax=Flavobacterium sp. PS2 TaxID=3384157 RepID=UPI00390C4866